MLEVNSRPSFAMGSSGFERSEIMTDESNLRAEPEPVLSEDPRDAAERISRDPAKKGSPEWLAAMQLLADEGKSEKASFADLETEMQKLKGMSQI